MRIELTFVELFSPLFLGKKNHQQKIDTTMKPDMKMWYDRKEKEIIIQYQEHVAILPWTAANSMTPKDISFLDLGPAPKKPEIVHDIPRKPIKAQVSAPDGIKI